MSAELRKLEHPVDTSVVEVLESYLQDAKAGEIISVCVVAQRVGGEYSTGGSKDKDVLKTGAMLIELGMRRLGFKQ